MIRACELGRGNNKVWVVMDDRFVSREECSGYALWLSHSGRAINTQKAYQLRLSRFHARAGPAAAAQILQVARHATPAWRGSLDAGSDAAGGSAPGPAVLASRVAAPSTPGHSQSSPRTLGYARMSARTVTQ